MNIDATTRTLLVKVLRRAGEQFSNHTCTDLVLEDTPEMAKLVEHLQKYNNDPEWELARHAGNIYATDWYIMSALADMLEERLPE